MDDRDAVTDQERPAGLTSVGATLASAREEQQRSLESVAADLHLQPEVVRAIENGDEAKLPASTFLRGYVRSYARLLGLNDTPLTAQLPLLNQYQPVPLKRVGMRRRAGVSLPRVKWLMWSLVLAALTGIVIYGVPAVERLWSQRSSEPLSDQLQLPLTGSEEAEKSSESAGSVLLPVPHELQLGDGPINETEVTETVQPGGAGAPVERPDTDQSRSSEPLTLDAEAEADKEKSSESRQVAPRAAGPAVIQMRFLEDSWVEMEANGRKLVVGTQPAGSERTVSAEPPIEILLGNAPGVEISYRGEAVDLTSYQRGKVARLTLDD